MCPPAFPSLVALCAGILAIFTAPHLNAQNLLQNAGFQNGLANWNWSLTGGATATASSDAAIYHQGASSAKFSYYNSYQNQRYAVLGQTLTGLIPGKNYYVRLWCKAIGAGSYAEIATGSQWQFRCRLPSGTYDWTLVEFTFVADAAGIPFLILLQDATNTLWIDDISVADRPEGNRNLIQESGFEKQTPLWAWSANGGSRAAATWVSAQRHWQESCMQFTNPDGYQSNRYGALRQEIGGLTAGKTYHVTLWCKGQDVEALNQVAIGTTWQNRISFPTGTYDWRILKYSFVADAATVPLLILIQSRVSGLWVDDVYVTEKPMIDVTTLGVAGNDTDVTTALRNALATSPFLYFPAGTYRITSSVALPQGAILWGSPGSSTIKMPSASETNFFNSRGTSGRPAWDIEVSGLRFSGTKSQVALYVERTRNILLRNCSSSYAGLLACEAPFAYNQVASEEQLSRNVVVSHNIATSPDNSLSNVTRSGVSLAFAADARISRNTISYFNHGVMWWGGDSNYDKDGRPGNPRWARRIEIDGNQIRNIKLGGIWGSMGQGISVAGNTVSICGDNGIDFEGCIDSIAEGNTVSDGTHGCLTAYYGAVNVVFRNNMVSTGNPAWPLYRTFNSSSSPHRTIQDVTLSGNTFASSNGVGVVDDGYGPVKMKILNNTLSNVRIDLTKGDTGWDVHGPVIQDNRITISGSDAQALTAIKIFYSFDNANVSRNVIRYTGSSPANKTGIGIRRSNVGVSTITLDRNSVGGFQAADILVTADGPSDTAASITNNAVQFRRIHARKQTRLALTEGGNVDFNSVPVPITWLPW